MNARFFSTLALALVFVFSLSTAAVKGEKTAKSAKKQTKTCCMDGSAKECSDKDMKNCKMKDAKECKMKDAKDCKTSTKSNTKSETKTENKDAK